MNYVEPRIIGEHRVICECDGLMLPEQGAQVEYAGTRPAKIEWIWWRCNIDPLHITRAVPLPVQMARG